MAFGITTNTCPYTGDGLKVQSIKKTPRAFSVAEAVDACGQTVERKTYGGSDTILECECEYSFQSGTLPVSVVIGAETMIESITLATSNSDWPKITVKWREGLVNVTGLSFEITLPDIEPKRCAQNLGVEVGGDAKMASSTISYTCDFSEALDDKGAQGCSNFTNGKAEISVDAVLVGATATFTPAPVDGWDIENTGKGTNESNTEYATVETFKASKALVAKVAPAA